MTDALTNERLRKSLAVASTRVRPHIPDFVQRCTQAIQQSIEDYAPSASGNRQRIISDIAEHAATTFCALLEERQSDQHLNQATQRLAARTARTGENIDAFRAALSCGRTLAHRTIRHLTAHGEIPAHLEAAFTTAIDTYITALLRDVEHGYKLGAQEIRRHPSETRRTLALCLFNGSWDDRCDELATILGMKVPARFYVLSFSAALRTQVDLGDLEHLYVTSGDEVTLTCDSAESDRLLAALEAAEIPLAAFTTVDRFDHVAAAGHETLTLFRLAAQDITTQRSGLLDCRDYTQLIWLANAPTQWEALLAEYLAPFDNVKGSYREQLIETLRLYLLTRGTAPQLATALGTHPQTVRARLRTINLALGDVIEDPRRSMTLLLLLNTTRTLRAGDQPDTRARDAS